MKKHHVWFFEQLGSVRVFALALMAFPPVSFGLGQARYVEEVAQPGSFRLVDAGAAATLYVGGTDYPGVARAARDLQSDIARVTNRTPALTRMEARLGRQAVIIGTIGKSALVDRLIRERKIDARSIAGKWEAFFIQVVPKPLPGVANAVVVVGSDKRGTIYGIYDLSEQIGVSPWYWWADVPVPHKDNLFIKAGRYEEGEPAVKYRGIFLNDEEPALSGWVKETFGGYNHEFYVKVFELLLRLKSNYLWPAMWGSAFNEDDPLNPKLADEYGIVMGTSHHEPMLRAQQEWKRHGDGIWDYRKNSATLQAFWDEGIERNKNYESILTMGMRGDGDGPMDPGGDISKDIKLLEKIVADQREIISRRMNPNPASVPQLWALYKEVQEYYEKGMRVPDDVTLLWSDDNWGNLRRVPTEEERARGGGAGIYYHFDYFGGPRSYKWLNTIPITKVWEQMNLAHEYGANRIWIVNVGDLKPMEFPIEFFLNLARDPERWTKDHLAEFTRLWAEREFGPAQAAGIADVVSKYTKYNARRKPELLDPGTFSLENYDEADRVLTEWKSLVDEAEQIDRNLPQNARDAFFQLVLYPAKASAVMNELYITVARNRKYAAQGRAGTNDLAAQAEALFRADAALATSYNHDMAGGKWDHMMDQTHIGYDSWRDPPANVMPKVETIDPPNPAEMGIAVEGSSWAWPGVTGEPVLPRFDSFRQPRRYIDIFNRGRASFHFQATPSDPWIVLSRSKGKVEKEQRIWVSIDWNMAPKERATGSVKITGASLAPISVRLEVFNPSAITRNSLDGFVEGDGYVSIEADHYTKKNDAGAIRWDKIEDYGRTGSSMTLFPVTAKSVTPPEPSPCLEYRMFLFDTGNATVHTILAPTLNFVPGRGLRFAIAFDNEPPRIIDALERNKTRDWEQTVKDSVRVVTSTHVLAASGYHTLKVWMVDPGVVVQKFIVDLGGMKPSYLGPPESYRN